MKTADITDVQVVAACWTRQQLSEPDAIAILAEVTGAPYKVAASAMSRADRRKLIDWGTSIRSAWPTDAGLRHMGDVSRGTGFMPGRASMSVGSTQQTGRGGQKSG